MDIAHIAALLEPFLLQPAPLPSSQIETCRLERCEEPAPSEPRGPAFSLRSLPPSALDQISIYIDLLIRWNARISLTAIRDPNQIVTRHFGESLFLARHLFPSPTHGAPRVLDLGSGAGFPGLPLKIWAPEIHLTLVESNHKKAAFLREVARALTLTNINVIAGRAEALVDTLAPADVVTLRAVERFRSILPLATRFLAPAGRLALLIGSSQLSALATLAPSLHWLPPIPTPKSTAKALLIGINI